jgi:hypothetical protein
MNYFFEEKCSVAVTKSRWPLNYAKRRYKLSLQSQSQPNESSAPRAQELVELVESENFFNFLVTSIQYCLDRHASIMTIYHIIHLIKRRGTLSSCRAIRGNPEAPLYFVVTRARATERLSTLKQLTMISFQSAATIPRLTGAKAAHTARSQTGSNRALTFCSSLVGTRVVAKPRGEPERKQFFVAASKMKTRKAAAKRYKVTASGKVRTRSR